MARAAGTGWPEERDGHRNGQLEEVAGSDQRPRGRDVVRHPEGAHQPVGQAGIEVDLDQDGYCQQKHHWPLGQDVLGLEGEDQHQRGQQRHDRDGPELGRKARSNHAGPWPG